MLDAQADGKRLRFHVHAVRVQHGKGVARAVADGQYDVVGTQLLAAGQHHAAQVALAVRVDIDQQVVDALAETDLAAQLLDRFAHGLDHRHQAESADVRLADEEDFLGRAGLDELLQHLAPVVQRIADLAVQLAVGKRAGAALAELDVGLGVQFAFAPQVPGVARAFAHGLAAVEDDRPKPHLRQDQSGKQPARPEADDDRPMRQRGRRTRHRTVGVVGRDPHVAIVGMAREDGGLVGHLHVQRVDQRNGAAPPRVVAAAEHVHAQQRVGRDAEPGAHGGRQRRRVMVQRQLDVSQSQHAWGIRAGGRSACCRRDGDAAASRPQPPRKSFLPMSVPIWRRMS